MNRPGQFSITLILSGLLLAETAMASVISVGPGAFSGASVLNFTGLADNTEVNGLTVNGVLSTYSLRSGAVTIDGGPGLTNNITLPNILSIGNDAGILTVTLPSLVNLFGYGYAVLTTVAVANATTITLFNGATPVGSLSFYGALDPSFAGGFAGILSTLPFNKAELTFNSAAAPALCCR